MTESNNPEDRYNSCDSLDGENEEDGEVIVNPRGPDERRDDFRSRMERGQVALQRSVEILARSVEKLQAAREVRPGDKDDDLRPPRTSSGRPDCPERGVPPLPPTGE